MSHCSLGMQSDKKCKDEETLKPIEYLICEIEKHILLDKLNVSLTKNKEEHIFLNAKIDGLIEKLNTVLIFVNRHEEHLKKIDKIALCDPDKVILNEKILNQKIKNLESKFEDLEQKSSLNSEKRPFKCPVCKGDGEVIINTGQMLTCYPLKYPTKVCNACKGKGIIWKDPID